MLELLEPLHVPPERRTGPPPPSAVVLRLLGLLGGIEAKLFLVRGRDGGPERRRPPIHVHCHCPILQSLCRAVAEHDALEVPKPTRRRRRREITMVTPTQ